MRPAADLESFAAGALDWPELRGLLAGLASGPLGRGALESLGPRPLPGGEAGGRPGLDDVASALGRLAELCDLPPDDRPLLAGLEDPRVSLERARSQGRALEVDELLDLRRFLGARDQLARWAEERGDRAPECARLLGGLPDLTPVRERLLRTLDERGALLDEASPRLGALRREIAELEQAIGAELRALAAQPRIRSCLSDPRPLRRYERAVLAVKAKSAGRVRGIVHDRSQSEQTVFVEPESIVERGNRLAAARHDERREVAALLVELTRDLLDRAEPLAEAARRLAELELAAIGLRACERFEARVPRLPGEPGAAPGLDLRAARHPLLVEQLRAGRLDEVVPIDLRLADDFDLLVVTGPNTGGKTLALKTAGLAVLCTRLGLPFPCDPGSTVPAWGGIVADIGDEQEIQQNLSTFASHLVRIREGLGRADGSTLVLLDELGGGTDPDEGAALGDAVLEALLTCGAPTLATTHLGRLKEFAYRHHRAENACVEFDPQTLAPRYRVLIGTPGESSALVIAARLGLPPELVEQAESRLERRDAELSSLMADVRSAREHAERLRGEATTNLRSIDERGRALEAERERLDRRGEQLEAEAQRELEERVRGARASLERARALLQQVPAPSARPVAELLDEVERLLGEGTLGERRSAFLAGLSKGQYVWVARYRKRCVVTRVDRGRRQITVRLGPGTLTLPFEEVTWLDAL